jgi:predicted membrane protein
MKMGWGIFWGIILILIGASFIIKVIFKIDFPVMKFMVAFFFIFLGIRILIGSRFVERHSEHDVVFNESRVQVTEIKNKEYNVVFGKSVIDLRNVSLQEGRTRMTINTVFGGSEIILNDSTPVRIDSDVAFGGAQLPDGTNNGGFGSTTFRTDNLNEDSTYLHIKTNTVFGGCRIMKR